MCCKTLPMSGKRKANPSSHLYSILPAICQFHLILGQVPGSLQDVDAVAWNPFLETETVSLNYMIPLHGQGAHACALTHALSSASVSPPHPPSTASRHAKAGFGYTDFTSELHVQRKPTAITERIRRPLHTGSQTEQSTSSLEQSSHRTSLQCGFESQG